MGYQDDFKGIKHMEVCVLKIGLIYIYYSMDYYYLLFVINIVSLDKLGDQLIYLSLKPNVLHFS